MSQLNEFNQNNLLFKRFQGKVQTNILTTSTYANESDTKSLKNVYNDTIFSSNVSKDISQNYTCFNLDAGPINSGNINVPNVSDTLANSFTTGIYGSIDIVNTTNLRFYKKVFLKNVSATPYSWWLIDPNGADPSTDNNLLKDMIPYSYNDLDLAMFTPIVYYYRGTVPPGPGDEDDPNNWTSVEQQQPPLYWLIDYESGVLQLYAELDSNGKITGTEIIIPTTNPPNAYQVPRISFIKYVGEKGAAGGGGGGDASGNLDLSGNLSVGGNLTVVGDASFCNVLVNCDLDVSGNTDMSGNLTVVKDVTFNKNIIANYSGSNTNLIQSENFVLPAPIPSPTNPNNEETSIIAQVNSSPSTPNEPFNATGYFTIEINSGTDPSNYFKAHFIAGIINDSQSNNPPGFNYYSFIKVLSVERGLFGFGINNPGILNIKLFKSFGTEMVYLALTYSSISSIPIRIRLYKNSENIIGEDNHLSWVLRSQPLDLTNVLMKNIYIGPGPDIPVPPATSPQNPLHPVEPFTTTTQYNIIDNSMNIYGNLYNTGNLRVDGDTQLQDTDICGNLYVDRDASFNRSVYIRDTIDVSNNANIQNDLTVGGKLDVIGNIHGKRNLKIDNDVAIGGSLTVDGSGNFGGVVTTVGNTTLVEYIRRNTPSTSKGTYTSPEWFTIAEVDSSSGNTVSSGLFQIIDKTPSIKQILSVIVTFYEGSSEKAAINVISNNWVLPGVSNAPTPPYIRQIRVIDINNIIYLQLDRFGYSTTGGTDTTNMDIRLYNNTNANLEYGNIKSADWVLRGNVAEPVGSGTSHALVNLRQGINSSGTASANPTRSNLVTNSYSYMAGGAKIGNTLDMDSNNIENISQLKGSNTSNNINFNNSGNLRLNAQNTLAFGTNGSNNDIEFSNSNLDFNGSNKIENLSNINQNSGNITIGNQNNLVTIDASQVEIKSYVKGAIAGDIVLEVSGGGTGSIILKNAASSGDITYKLTNFDLKDNTLKVDEMESSTTNQITIKNDLDLDSNEIQKVANLNTDGHNLTVGKSTHRVTFKSITNMFNDTKNNVNSKLTTVGDLAICNSPDSQKGIIFNNNSISSSLNRKYQVSTGTAIYHFFNNMTTDKTLSNNPATKIWYYHSRFFGSAGTNNINSNNATSSVIYGYTIPFWGSLDALIINGYENALVARTSGSSSYNLKISIGIWAGATASSSTTRYLESYTISQSNVAQNTTLLNLGECVFTRDQTMTLVSPSDNSLTSSGIPSSPVTPTNWFVNNEPLKWNNSSLSRIGLIIKIENMGSNAPTIAWQKSSLGAQTFLKMDVPWNIP